MSITSVGSGANYTPAAKDTYSAQKSEGNDNGNNGNGNNITSLRIDTSHLTGEAAERLGVGKNINLPQSTLRQLEMSMKLQSTLKAQALSSQEANSHDKLLSPSYEDLASAYDQVRRELNENSENSNKHGKFLDDAFADLVRFHSARTAEQIGVNITGSPKNSTTIDGVNPFVVSAEKQAAIFSDAFLKEYKKNGLDSALSKALSALDNMPETTSLFNISFKDFQALKVNNADYLLSSADAVDKLLGGKDLSGYMKDILSKSYNHYKTNHSGYGLVTLPSDKSLRLDTIA